MTEKPPVLWCFITPEYPPTVGGVADYVRLVATHMVQAGQQVTVLAPSRGEPPRDAGLTVEPVLGKFGLIGFWCGSKVLDSLPRPRRLFLQWVPHGFGFKSMNLLLVLWVWWRVVIRRDQLWIMAHEPFFRFEKSLKQCVAAGIHRIMVWVLLACADQIFAGNRLWVTLLSYWAPKDKPINWLPVPSTVPIVFKDDIVKRIKSKFSPEGILVGSFGTYGSNTSSLLASYFERLLDNRGSVSALFIGKNSEKFADSFLNKKPQFAGRVFSTGSLDHNDLSNHLKACDFFVQLNEEGLSTRNTTLMAILSMGKTGVGNFGAVTDLEWNYWKGFLIVGPCDVGLKMLYLVDNPKFIEEMEVLAKELYKENFSLEIICARLLASS